MPEISIPASVTSIGNYTFNNCSSLADVVIEDRTSELTLGSNGSSPLFASCPLDSVYIGGKIKYDTSSSSGYSPFYRNTSLRTIVISDTEEESVDICYVTLTASDFESILLNRLNADQREMYDIYQITKGNRIMFGSPFML